jgi:hypothetical protein
LSCQDVGSTALQARAMRRAKGPALISNLALDMIVDSALHAANDRLPCAGCRNIPCCFEPGGGDCVASHLSGELPPCSTCKGNT